MWGRLLADETRQVQQVQRQQQGQQQAQQKKASTAAAAASASGHGSADAAPAAASANAAAGAHAAPARAGAGGGASGGGSGGDGDGNGGGSSSSSSSRFSPGAPTVPFGTSAGAARARGRPTVPTSAAASGRGSAISAGGGRGGSATSIGGGSASSIGGRNVVGRRATASPAPGTASAASTTSTPVAAPGSTASTVTASTTSTPIAAPGTGTAGEATISTKTKTFQGGGSVATTCTSTDTCTSAESTAASSTAAAESTAAAAAAAPKSSTRGDDKVEARVEATAAAAVGGGGTEKEGGSGSSSATGNTGIAGSSGDEANVDNNDAIIDGGQRRRRQKQEGDMGAIGHSANVDNNSDDDDEDGSGSNDWSFDDDPFNDDDAEFGGNDDDNGGGKDNGNEKEEEDKDKDNNEDGEGSPDASNKTTVAAAAAAGNANTNVTTGTTAATTTTATSTAAAITTNALEKYVAANNEAAFKMDAPGYVARNDEEARMLTRRRISLQELEEEREQERGRERGGGGGGGGGGGCSISATSSLASPASTKKFVISQLGESLSSGSNNANHNDSGKTSWPALIDFEGCSSTGNNECYADAAAAAAADNFNDSSRSLGSVDSLREMERLENDVEFIRRETAAETKKVAKISKMKKKAAAGVHVVHHPHDHHRQEQQQHEKKSKDKEEDNTPRMANRLKPPSKVGGRGGGVQTQSRVAATKKAPAKQKKPTTATAKEQPSPSSPKPPSQVQQRIGASAGTRSAVKEMALAKRKFAAAVQKIEDEDGDDDNANNWSFDDEDDDGDLNKFDTPMDTPPQSQQQQQQQPKPPTSQLYHTLVDYISSLSDTSSPLITSLNSVLQAELNTDENAAELIHYYKTRPHLLQYTVDTELPRMDYLVVTEHDQFLDKDDINLYVESTEDQRDEMEALLWRSANQSLLADLIASLTGEDRLIRPSIMVTAVAESCKFELNLCHGGKDRCVAAMADLSLSVPSGTNDEANPRLALGNVRARIRFVPESHIIDYSIVSASPLLSPDSNPSDAERLRVTATSLERDMTELAGLFPTPHHDQLSRSAHDDIRDQFLATVSVGATGLQSAWREIDSTVNLSSKMSWIGGVLDKASAALPALPTAEEIDEVEREHTVTFSNDNNFPDHAPPFPRAPVAVSQPDEKAKGFMDQLADASDNRQEPPPPQPAARAMGFLDRIVNELEAPPQQQQPTQVFRPSDQEPSAARGVMDSLADEEPNAVPRQEPPQQQFHPQRPQQTSAVPAPAEQFPRPQPDEQGVAEAEPIVRPPPLIGGILLGGLTRLAKSAAAPEQPTSIPRPAPPDEEGKFYREESTPAVQPSRISHAQQQSDPRGMQYEQQQQHQDQPSPITEPSQDENNKEASVDADDGGWSDEDDLDLDDNDGSEGKVEPKPPVDRLSPKVSPKLSPEGTAGPPAFESFAARLCQAGAPPLLQKKMSPKQAAPPLSNQSHQSSQFVAPAPPSAGGASVSTGDGSYTIISMSSLEKELPEFQNWLEVEAIDNVDESGIIPTRKRWVPARMRGQAAHGRST